MQFQPPQNFYSRKILRGSPEEAARKLNNDIMYFVYILLSCKDKRTYVGYTKNLEIRLQQHNAGRVKATKFRRPLQLLHFEKFQTLGEAKQRELWWKSSSGRIKLKYFFNK